MFATLLLLVTSGMIGSGHTVLAHNSKVIGNSGNYQETQQSCGNSCTVSSSNVITQEQGSRIALPPGDTELALGVSNVTNGLLLISTLSFSANDQIVTAQTGAGLSITFTGTGVPPNLVATVQDSQQAIFRVTIKSPTTPDTYTFQAHFAGATLILNGGQTLQLHPSDSSIVMFTVP